MRAFLLLLLLSGVVPLGRCWWAARYTSLIQAVHWAIAAWLAWLATMLLGDAPSAPDSMDPSRYLAVSLTGCAGIAVLGARRPHAGAWNFVVLGLLAVLVLPLAEGLFLRSQPPGEIRFIFLTAVLCVGVLNYLPTRMFPAVVLLSCAEAGAMLTMSGSSHDGILDELTYLCLGLVPWVASACWRGRAGILEFDCLWFTFRDRYGLVWAQRVREQFNRSAANAGWALHLSWRGLRRSGTAPLPAQEEALKTLQALLKRFQE